MKLSTLIFIIQFGFPTFAFSQDGAKLLLLPFQLNDMTDLPNAPDELNRIALLSKTVQKSLEEKSVNLVAVPSEVLNEMEKNSATYIFDRVEVAAEIGAKAGADYVFVGVALKPTYLFVYPRVLLIDVQTKKVTKARAFQLESSWTDQNTTIITGKKIANAIKEDLDKASVKGK